MERIDYPDTDMMALSLARRLAGELRAALTRRPRALFAVPGGTSPGPVFDLLAAADLDWDRVDIVPTDERWLPESHARSNAGMIRARLLRDKAVPARLLPLWHEALSPAEGAEQAAAMLDRLLPVDVALLGMGADMHTASLFPGATGLDEALAADAPAVVPILAPGAPEPRVSLSARVLKDAYGLHLLIIGAEKRAALERARPRPDRGPGRRRAGAGGGALGTLTRVPSRPLRRRSRGAPRPGRTRHRATISAESP